MRERMKKLAVYLMTVVMMLSCISVDGATVKAEGMSISSFDPIGYLLNRYQVVVSGDITNTAQDSNGDWTTDLTCGAHLMGAVLIGGAINSTNSIGDASVAPSYIKDLKGLQPWGRGYENQVNPYEEHGSPFINPSYVYYDTISDALNSTVQSNDQLKSRYVQNVGYADVSSAVTQVATQSSALADAATPLTVKDGVLEVDFTKGGANYSVDSASLTNATIKLNFTDINDLANNLCTLSITGTSDFNYDKVEIYVNGTKMNNDKVIEDMDRDSTLTEMGITTTELNLIGMNLLFNFPDMTNLTFSSSGVAGHIVAPNADVTMLTGNFEGGIIAKAFHTESAQGHFYPMTKTVTYSTVSTLTADVTFSKTSAASTGELAGAEITLSTTDADLTDVTKDATSGGIIKARTDKSITWTSTTSAMILKNLPAGTYTMTEVTAPAGYKTAEAITFTIDTNGDVYQGNTKLVDNKITMVDAPKEGSIVLTGTKVVTGDGATSGTYSFVVKKGDVQVSKGSVTTSKTVGATITFDKITYGPEDIGEHVYTITEVIPPSLPEGFTFDSTVKTVTVVVKDTTSDSLSAEVKAGSDEITFTNKYETVSKKVTKVWADDDNSANVRPTSVAVQLKADGINKGASVTLNAANSWTHTWSDLPKTNSQGIVIEYTVDELSVPDGYSKSVTTASNGDVTITNTYPAIPIVTADVTFSKTDVVSTRELAGATITLSTTDADLSGVTKDAASGGIITSQTAKSITWTSTTSSIELKNLPEGTYTMTEVTAPEGYKKAEAITFKIDENRDVYQGSTKVTGNKIVMKDAPEEGSITFSVTKDLTGDVAPEETYTFVLKDGNGTELQTGTITGEGTYTFTPIKYIGPDDIGDYTYTITEQVGTTAGMEYDTTAKIIKVKVADGTEKLDVSVLEGSKNITITNKYTKPTVPKTGSIYLTGKKILAGDTAPSEKYDFVVQEGAKKVATGSITGAGDFAFSKIEYTSGDIGTHTYTITEIAGSTSGMVYDNSMITVEVTVTEDTDELDATITKGAGTIEFTNTYTSPTPTPTTIDKTIKKVWADVNDTDKIRPTSVEVAILADDVETGKTVTLNADNNWEVKVESLPITDSTGKEIVYTIEEKNVPTGYAATYSTSGDILTVTNKHTPTAEDAPATGGLKITVIDEKTNGPVPGATVEVKYPDGTVETKTTDSNGEINYPQDPGVPTGNYEITVTKVPDGYTVTTGETGSATVVENKVAEHIAKIKTATGGLTITVVDEKTNDPVPGATVQIQYPDGTVETKTTDSNGQIKYPQDPGIPTGDYEITVTDVPDGYTVTTGQTGKVTVVENTVVEHVAKIDVAEDSTSRDDEDEENDEDSDEHIDEEDDDSGNKSSDKDNGKDSDSTTRTGDDSPIRSVVVIMFIALALLGILFFIRRRNNAY